jgi:hypothetical protein
MTFLSHRRRAASPFLLAPCHPPVISYKKNRTSSRVKSNFQFLQEVCFNSNAHEAEVVPVETVGSGGVVPLIQNLCTKLEMSRKLHPPATLPTEKSPRYQLNRRLGRPHSRSGLFGDENLSPVWGIEPRYVSRLYR